MYCMVKRCRKVLESSHYVCVLRYLLLLLLSFPYNTNQAKNKPGSLLMDRLLLFFFVLGPYSPHFKEVCIQNGHPVRLFDHLLLLFFFKGSCWLPCLRELTVPRMLLSRDWGPTKWDTKSRSVPVSTCMQAFTHCTSNRFCSTWLWKPLKRWGGSLLLKKKKKKYCLHLFLYIFSVAHPPSPSPYLQVQFNLRKHFKRIKWYNWEIFGGSLAN